MSVTALRKAETQETQDRVSRFLTTNAGFLEPDPAIMRNHRLSPRTEREEKAIAACTDPHLLRDISSRMVSVLDESFEISEQTVAAPAGKFADLATAFMTASGDISLLSNRGVAAFATVLHYPAKFILKYFENDPSVGVKEGDAFLQNDARYGGVHSPDQGMLMPVFYKGELIAWTICAMHEGEIGARPPGGMGPSIESPYEEGFRGSPIKIADNFQLKTDLVTLLQNSCREPQTMLVDLRARLATCIRLRDQLLKLIDQYGADAIIASLRQTPEFVADEAARRIQEMPDGTARVDMYADTTMREPALVKAQVSLTVKGSKLILDVRGSSPEIANRPINCPFSGISTGAMMAFMHFFWPDIPKSPAVLEHLEIITDPESIYDASYNVPIALNMHCVFKIITSLEILLSKFTYSLPNKYATIKAPWFNQPAGMLYGGETQHGSTVGNLCADLNGMGGGARHHLDGEHSISPNFAAMVDTGESELMEEFLPYINFTSKRLEPDTGSFGKFRGGQGYQMMYVRYGTQPFGFQTIAGGSKFPSTVGLFGGYGCATYPIVKIKGVNLFEVLKEQPELFEARMSYLLNERPFPGATYEAVPFNMEFELAYAGEMYMICQGAGGGYGDVLERDPEFVMKDVREGLISHETARDLYKVVYDEKSLLVNADATREARNGERRSRIGRAKPYLEFVKEKVRPSPPTGILYFGSWNDSEQLHGGVFKALPGKFPTPIYLPDPRDIMKVTLHNKLVTSAMEKEEIVRPPLSSALMNSFHVSTLTRIVGLSLLAARQMLKAAGSVITAQLSRSEGRRGRLLRGMGKALADFLHDGGPTFTKLGQVLSTRPDLLPEEVIEELSYLQDRVAPMSFASVKRIVEADLGDSLEKVFKEFNPEPIAAGSVAQVHKAVLPNGMVAAVKVLREGLEKRFESDLRALGVLTRAAYVLPGVAGVKPLDLIDEFGKALRGQMDFETERVNNRRLAESYKHLDWVRLPEIYDDHCGDHVITMEFVTGKKPDEYMRARKEPDPELARHLYELYIDMAFNTQLLHVDLHAGNLLIDESGKIVLLDTGLVHKLPSYYARRYIRAYLCVSAVDGWLQVDNYFSGRTHLIDPKQRTALAKDLHEVYQSFDRNRETDFTKMWIEVLNSLRRNKVALDREFVMMMVADMTMAGMARSFDPSFDVVEFLRQELPNLIFHKQKLALNDPYLIAAMRSDLLKQVRAATGWADEGEAS